MAPILRTQKLTGIILFPGKKTQFTKNRVGFRILFNIWLHTTVIFFMEERSKLQKYIHQIVQYLQSTPLSLTCLQLLSPHTRPPSHSSSPSQSPSPATQGSALVQHRPWSTSRPAQRNAEKNNIEFAFKLHCILILPRGRKNVGRFGSKEGLLLGVVVFAFVVFTGGLSQQSSFS